MVSAKLLCLSHTPLMAHLQPEPATLQAVQRSLQEMKESLEEFNPEIIFLFAPDHFNGFFYDLMPPFCIGAEASSVGDWDTVKGLLNVPCEIAVACTEAVMAEDVDCALSYRMQVDHGFTQPLELLTGSISRFPVVPIFINSVAVPLPSFKRARLLGQAVGRFAAGLGKRVLFMASGGLSHSPPVPMLAGAPPEVAERLIAGRNPTAEARMTRQQRVIDVAQAFANGKSSLQPLNPEWDRDFIAVLKSQDLAQLDSVRNADVTAAAGNSAHEVKAWLAANAAMSAATSGHYGIHSDYYAAIPEWIAGFAVLQGDAA